MPASCYRCVHCLAKSDSLYRKYGTNTIKLSQCTKCKGDVDPYCEREWLLVTLDCFLLRDEAYRHVLFHRFVELNVDTRRATFLLLTAILLRALLVGEATQLQQQASSGDMMASSQQVWFLERTLVSCIALLSIAAGLYTAFWITTMNRGDEIERLMTRSSSSTGNSGLAPRTSPMFTRQSSLALQVYLAILLPTIACQVLTLIIHIWESSSMTRQLGSLLLLLYQWKGLTNLLQAVVTENRQWSHLYSTLILTMGLLLRAVALVAWNTMTDHPQACPGLEWNVSKVALHVLPASSICFA